MTINTNYMNGFYHCYLGPTTKPAKRLGVVSTSHDIAGISRLRDMKLNIMREEMVTHTGFEPMLTA